MKEVITENRKNLDRLEETIQRNLQSFVEVAHALKEIRSKNYYRDVLEYETFEQYCRDRWDMGRRYMNRLIAAGDVVDNLVPMGTIPSNERQTRPLTALTPEQQRQAWQIVIESTPEGKITERSVIQAVKKVAPKNVTDGEHPNEMNEAMSPPEKESRYLGLLKKYWQSATASDRETFRLWIGESEQAEGQDTVDLPAVVRTDHENHIFAFPSPVMDDMDEARMLAAG